MATARELRPPLVAALRTGFTDRGWEAPRSGAGVFRLAAGEGLTVRWRPDVAGDKYGGIRFGGSGGLVADEVTAQLLSFPDDALPVDVVEWPAAADRAALCSLAVETAGGLVDPKGDHVAWVVREAEESASAIEGFFAMVDGPLQSWIRSVTPVRVLLDWALTDPAQLRASEIGSDAMALLALEHGRPEVARAVLGRFPARHPAQRTTAARFERELAERHPSYGGTTR